jgi:hypothetical protein
MSAEGLQLDEKEEVRCSGVASLDLRTPAKLVAVAVKSQVARQSLIACNGTGMVNSSSLVQCSGYWVTGSRLLLCGVAREGSPQELVAIRVKPWTALL